MAARAHTVALELAVVACLLACCYLLYLEWWRAGEFELVLRRVEELERRPVPTPRTRKPKTTEAK